MKRTGAGATFGAWSMRDTGGEQWCQGKTGLSAKSSNNDYCVCVRDTHPAFSR